MKYFTPDLYLKCNSDNETIFEKAFTEWEELVEYYADELKNLNHGDLGGLPQAYLHDYIVLKSSESNGLLVSTYKRDFNEKTRIVSIGYKLLGKVTETPASADYLNKFPPNPKRRLEFLYDEIHKKNEGYIHHIFLNDGRVLNIPFEFSVVNEDLS